MSSRWVCSGCGGWCEVLTEGGRKPERCPYHHDENTEWEDLDKEDEEQEEK